MPNPYGRFVEDPLSASGYRWKRYDEPEPTGLLPVVSPSPQPRIGGTIRYQEFEDHQLSGQDDLSHLDESAGELVSTEKIGPLDEVLIQPSQDPEWRPEGAA